jgi:hypothetical protein
VSVNVSAVVELPDLLETARQHQARAYAFQRAGNAPAAIREERAAEECRSLARNRPNVINERSDGFRVQLSGRFSLVTMAMEAQDNYCTLFPGEAYGTRFADIHRVGSDFIVSGQRYASCE